MRTQLLRPRPAPTRRGKPGVAAGLRLNLAQQFGDPKGLAGRFVGKAMAKWNAGFNVWVVNALRTETKPGRILELGFGPGVAMAGLVAAFPTAQVFGIDRSADMLAEATRRN